MTTVLHLETLEESKWRQFYNLKDFNYVDADEFGNLDHRFLTKALCKTTILIMLMKMKVGVQRVVF